MSEEAPQPNARAAARLAKERVATRLGVRTISSVSATTPEENKPVTTERFGWLNDSACADLEIDDFFVPAGHAISEEKLNVCRACPVRTACLEHAYAGSILNGYFGGMSPGQRRALSLAQARRFIASDPPRR